MQHVGPGDSKLGLEIGLHRDWVADVAKHEAVRRARGLQSERSLLERVGVKVDTTHDKRVLVQPLPAHGVLLDVEVNRLEQRAVAAAHVRDDERLLLQRSLVEDPVDVDVHHVGKVAIVHEA